MISTFRTRIRTRAGRVDFLIAVGAKALIGCRPSSPEADASVGGAEVARPVEAIPPDSVLAWRRGPLVDPTAPLHLVAFGSCNRQDLPQPLWSPIVAADPDLWIWLGDNVYGDTDDMAVLQAKYERLLAEPGYRSLVEGTPIVGTWDDHDYGLNDGGSEFGAKEESQRELLDFLGEPAVSPRRSRAGVYTSTTYGPPGRRVKVILLDARYHRDTPNAEGTGDLLGEDQWAWLAAELAGSDAQLHLVGGGIQFLPVDHRYEKWNQFPAARERLFRVLGESGAPAIILLSGDRHLSEIHRIDDTALGYPLYEVTSSGLTHSFDNVGEEPNRYRVGELFNDLSFGTMALDWDAGTVALQLRDREGVVVRETVVALGALRSPAEREGERP